MPIGSAGNRTEGSGDRRVGLGVADNGGVSVAEAELTDGGGPALTQIRLVAAAHANADLVRPIWWPAEQ